MIKFDSQRFTQRFKEYSDSIDGADDRTTIILTLAIIDRIFLEIICKIANKGKDEISNDLVKSNEKIFTDFSKRARFIHNMEIISSSRLQTFLKLADLRNQAAHYWGEFQISEKTFEECYQDVYIQFEEIKKKTNKSQVKSTEKFDSSEFIEFLQCTTKRLNINSSDDQSSDEFKTKVNLCNHMLLLELLITEIVYFDVS